MTQSVQGAGSAVPVEVVVFDVNETLSDMTPMADRFEQAGMAREQAALWFASVLRDGFALATTGRAQPFAVIGENVLRAMRPPDPDAAWKTVLGGFLELDLHPDIAEGVRRLKAAGVRLVTLTNGSTAISEKLLTTGGIRDDFEMLLSVEDAGLWKPARQAYEYAATTVGVPIEAMALVAVHPWDIDGAIQAGMTGAWIDRNNTPYPKHLTTPTVSATTLPDLADLLVPTA